MQPAEGRTNSGKAAPKWTGLRHPARNDHDANAATLHKALDQAAGHAGKPQAACCTFCGEALATVYDYVTLQASNVELPAISHLHDLKLTTDLALLIDDQIEVSLTDTSNPA